MNEIAPLLRPHPLLIEALASELVRFRVLDAQEIREVWRDMT